MVRTRLTSIGKLFLGLMLLFYVASVTSQSGLLILFIGLMGGCFIVNGFFSRRNVANLRLSPPKLQTVVEGSSAMQPWLIQNFSSKHAEMIEITTEAGLLFRIPAIRCRSSVWLVPGLVYDRRGIYPKTRITVSSAAPYGLLHSKCTVDLQGELIVLPRVYPAESPVANGFDFVAGGRFRGSRRVNTGTHFAGVRGWQDGDSTKQVHWNSTARRGELMVKTYEEELGGRVSLILDCIPDDNRIVDNAVRAAASVGVAALHDGQHLELNSSPDAEFFRLAPFSDEGEFLEILARYAPTQTAAHWTLDQFWRKSALVLVGTRWRPLWQELIEKAQQQNRRVYLYLPEGTHVPASVPVEVLRFSDSEILSDTHKPVAAS